MNLIYIDLRRERSRYQCRLTAYYLGVGVGWGVGVAEMSLVSIRMGLWWKKQSQVAHQASNYLCLPQQETSRSIPHLHVYMYLDGTL